jgi:ubiquitin-conjugating enzyme E2 I
MSGARERLLQERKKWRQDPPFGFSARPQRKEDGSFDMMKWSCIIPGMTGSLWEGGFFPLEIEFSLDYPSKPPKCSFPKGFYHPNIYPSGTVCLSILNEEKDWRPAISIKIILMGIRDLLAHPNEEDPAQEPALNTYLHRKDEYEKAIKEQTQKYALDKQ